ncbi:MAG: carbamoyltransferase HypF [Eubacterium sp.]|nr:carbamoyltransferase HypF [Eubacterium sp.]
MKSVPYDRENSTMAPFIMCPDCKADYDEPGSRRRFDQNIGCSECGPKLRYYENRLVDEVQMTQEEILNKTVESLKCGKIGAIKDIGGFHFMCIPSSEETVERLRSFKDTVSKPLAIMFPDVDTIRKYCYVSEEEENLLRSNARPIVLLARKEDTELSKDFAPNVLMGSAHIGATLPFDPLQIILAEEVGPLIITSGNRGGEPIITNDMDMIHYLPSVEGPDSSDEDITGESSGEISAVSFANDTIDKNETTYIGHEEIEENNIDFMLTNTREILAPLEDSVAQIARIHTGSSKRKLIQLVRRGRGYVPEAVVFDKELPKDTFAAGTDYQSSFAVGKKNVCYLSEYYGNITNSSVYDVREKAIRRLENLLDVKPKRYIGDLNPNYQTSKDADTKAMGTYIDGIPQRIVRRQHHASHVLSVAAEHSLTGRLLGISYDGTGYGTDETIWGSEIFSCVLNDTISEEEIKPDGTVETRPKIMRSGALLPVKLMGEQSSRDIKSTLCGYIRAVEERQLVSPTVVDKVLRILGIDRSDFSIVSACLRADIGIYYSACMGRLFDAVTALLGLKSRNTYGGESPIALEDAAMRAYRRNGVTLRDVVASELRMKVIEPKTEGEIYRMDQSILMADLMEKLVEIYDSGMDETAREIAIDNLAFDFHKAVVDSTVYIADKVCGRDYIHHIALTGGSMYNRLLLDGIGSSLERLGYRIFINSKVPGGDGGISLGQMYSELI